MKHRSNGGAPTWIFLAGIPAIILAWTCLVLGAATLGQLIFNNGVVPCGS